jgi:hypothetical protein
MMVFNLLGTAVLVLLVSLPRAESTERAHDSGMMSFWGGALVAAVAGFYWAFSVAKCLRLSDAAKYGASPGPVISSLFFLSLAFWLVATTIVPSCMLLRDPLTGRPIGDIIGRYNDYNPVFLKRKINPEEKISAGEWAEIQKQRADIRSDFANTARLASLFNSLWYTDDKPQWYELWEREKPYNPLTPSRGYLCQSLLDYAESQEPWRSRLASLQSWDTRNKVLFDPVLRERFRDTEILRTKVRDYILPLGQHDIESIAGADYIAPLAAEIEAAMMNGMRPPPPSLTPEVWQRVEARLFEAFMDSVPDEILRNREKLPASAREGVVKGAHDASTVPASRVWLSSSTRSTGVLSRTRAA